MTITILPEAVGKDGVTYRAISGARQSEGKTAGEALDALAKQLNEEEAGTLVIVQSLRPDRFFTTQQQGRLGELMTRWRSARDVNDTLPADDETELEELIETELIAATNRALAMSKELERQPQADQTDMLEEVKVERPFDNIIGISAVREALAHLNEREQEIVRLYYWEDQPDDEIAQRLGLTKSNVAKIRQRIIGKLRKRLDVKREAPAQLTRKKSSAIKSPLVLLLEELEMPGIIRSLLRKYRARKALYQQRRKRCALADQND
jgi:RNA polymerase sigma factor (sigma-70 family)